MEKKRVPHGAAHSSPGELPLQVQPPEPAGGPENRVELILQFDGGSRGNPGPAGIGVTLTAADGTMVYELGDFVGSCTNNVAEYTALVRGLKAALTLGAGRVVVRADSELVVRQMRGIYRVKSPDLKPLYQQACALAQAIGHVEFNHVYRMNNARADALANAAMDSRSMVEPMGPPKPITPAGRAGSKVNSKHGNS